MKKVVGTLLIGVLFLMGCEKEANEEMDPTETEHLSVVGNTTKWESVATSEFLISGRRGYSFESNIKYELGAVENGIPTFLGNHYYERSGLSEGPTLNMHVTSGSEIIHYNIPILLFNVSRSTIPQHILDFFGNNSIGQPMVTKLGHRRFRNNGQMWVQGNILLNSNSIATNRALVLKNANEAFGWRNYVWSDDFPSGFVNQIGTPYEVYVGNIGYVDLTQNGSTQRAYFMAEFTSNGMRRGVICRKDLQSPKLELDAVSVMPVSTKLDADQYPSYEVVAFDDNKIFGLYFNRTDDEVEVYSGNFTDGFSLLTSLPNYNYRSIVKGKNEFFLVYAETGTSSGNKAVKISSAGTVTDLGTVPVGAYSHLNGNLIVGTEESNEEIRVIEITGNGTRNSLAEGEDLSPGSAATVIFRGNQPQFASDGINLFVALKNWRSPKYKAAEQFGGMEIVKYKN
ncbi:MAG: hypothetical protein ACFB10_25800 [Salibacteraceae bacterium]